MPPEKFSLSLHSLSLSSCDSFLTSQRCVERDAETPPAKAAPHQSLSLRETMCLEVIFRILFVLRVSYGGLERFVYCSSSHSRSYMAYRSVYWQSPHHSSEGSRLGSFWPNFWDTIRSRRKSMRHALSFSHTHTRMSLSPSPSVLLLRNCVIFSIKKENQRQTWNPFHGSAVPRKQKIIILLSWDASSLAGTRF